MARILITGGSGFLGSSLARRLRDRGCEVRLFTRPSTRADRLALDGFDVARGDIGDSYAVDSALRGAARSCTWPRPIGKKACRSRSSIAST